ncbi:MAG: glutamate-5-semialdehyde dehydrogenase [Clostridiales bacterium]|nr:glutamate-5-semialdehyde dehydrogenase [Candidatus Equinaster intestinalis]
MTTTQILKAVKTASKELAVFSPDDKNRALEFMAISLTENCEDILRANAEDIKNASGISDVMLDRLRLTKERIEAMSRGIIEVKNLADPTGRVLEQFDRADGLSIKKITVPIGVVGIIYESRPNVTSDAAALCIKSGNACLLRSGKEAHKSATEIVKALKSGLKKAGLPENAVMLIEDISRQSANEMMRANGYIDLLIPRGGKGLISACVENATVPCIETGTGICHIFVHENADLDMALNIIENAKTSRPSVCNAAEVCLVDKKILKDFIPLLEQRLTSREIPVELRMDEECIKYSQKGVAATDTDFDTEFLDYILAVKAVDGVKDAVRHIDAHSTHHSEAIITEEDAAAQYFCSGVDSAAVYVNASTRFTDGGEFGLGCEMGISTQKLHARGPMGLKELTTYKYVIKGNGNIR